MLNFIKNIGPTEIIVLVVIVLLLFGTKIAMKLGKTGGETVKELKKVKKEFNEALKEDETSVKS